MSGTVRIQAHPLTTRVPGQARPRTQRNARGTHIRARAGIFTSPLWVKTPDLRASLRTAPRPGTQVADGAMTMAAHPLTTRVPGSRVACERNKAAIRDHVASASRIKSKRRDPGSLRLALLAAARPGKQVDGTEPASWNVP